MAAPLWTWCRAREEEEEEEEGYRGAGRGCTLF